MADDPILFANDTEEIFIIDIPTSIAAAQFPSGISAGDRESLQLLSCSPICKSYSSTEPKDASSITVKNHERDSDIHAVYSNLIQQASAVVRAESANRQFCLNRAVSHDLEDCRSRKRKRTEVAQPSYILGEDGSPASHSSLSTNEELVEMLHNRSSHDTNWTIQALISPNDLEEAQESLSVTDQSLSFQNNRDETMTLDAEWLGTEHEAFQFRIPPRSAFLMSKCERVTDFRRMARRYAPDSRGRFDVIILDPPWPNRSALRKSRYSTSNDTKSIQKLLGHMDLDSYILPRGFVAVWVTNKPALRNMILGHGGIFEKWNISLVEEWIWVKVTTSGEPVTQLDGVWRKPYEVLLIGQAPDSSLNTATPIQHVKRRVIFGVPDLHSRKPCLKQIFERFLLHRSEDYDALEVFSRYLVAGWLSWGDEVLKYNWQQNWVAKTDTKIQEKYTDSTV